MVLTNERIAQILVLRRDYHLLSHSLSHAGIASPDCGRILNRVRSYRANVVHVASSHHVQGSWQMQVSEGLLFRLEYLRWVLDVLRRDGLHRHSVVLARALVR